MPQDFKPSYTFTEDRLNDLKQLFPEAFEDGVFNVDTLKELIGEHSTSNKIKEHFGLNWMGKQDARKIASKPPTGTLKPCPGEGVNEDTTEQTNVEQGQISKEDNGNVTDVEDEEYPDAEDDNPLVVFTYKDIDYCYDSSKKLEYYYIYDDNDCIGEKVASLKYIKQKFVLEDKNDNKKYILSTIDGIPGEVIGEKQGKKSKLY